MTKLAEVVEQAQSKMLELLTNGVEMTARELGKDHMHPKFRHGCAAAIESLVAEKKIISRKDGRKVLYRLADTDELSAGA